MGLVLARDRQHADPGVRLAQVEMLAQAVYRSRETVRQRDQVLAVGGQVQRVAVIEFGGAGEIAGLLAHGRIEVARLAVDLDAHDHVVEVARRRQQLAQALAVARVDERKVGVDADRGEQCDQQVRLVLAVAGALGEHP